MRSTPDLDRRRFVTRAAAGGLLLAAGAGAAAPARKRGDEDEGSAPPVTPPEDLMREHGVLRRALQIYDECARRLESRHALPEGALTDTAALMRRFVHGYHERMEEELLFPRFEAAGRMTALVGVLRVQHQAGRRLGDEIASLAGSAGKDDDRARLVQALRAVTRMYRPHAAREDTELFPAIRAIMGRRDFTRLGETFEKRERETLGRDGFEGAVQQVARIEGALDLADLSAFTPRPAPPR